MREVGAPRALGSLAWSVSMALFASACATSDGRLEAELSRLRQEVHGLRGQVVASRDRVEALEAQVGRLERARQAPPAPRASRGPTLSPESPPAAPSEPRTLPAAPSGPRTLPVVRLSADGRASATDATATGPVMIRVRGERAERLAVDHEVLERPDPLSSASTRPAGAEPAYRQALDTLREEHDPALALERFDAFLGAYPKHHLADNALYWKGEALQTLVEHERALATFESLLRRHPQSNKAAWAKLRAAESCLALGNEAKGRRLLADLRATEPNSEPAKLARQRLEALADAPQVNR